MVFHYAPWAVVAGLAALLGCGDDTLATDGGAGATDSGGGAVVATPPDIPWLDEGVPPLMLAPCPEGWREVTENGISECDPYPVTGPATCETGEAHFLGEPGCRPIGTPCPAGDYAAALPTAGTVVYVKAGAAAGGDGSLEAPYAALSVVPWAGLSPGTTVALAKGTYPGTLQVKEGVRVIGACVRETRVTGNAGLALGVITALDGVGEATIQNLTIGETAQRAGVANFEEHSITLEGVLIDGVHTVGIAADGPGSMMTLSDTVIRGTRPRASDGTLGRGINLQAGAGLTATRLLVEGCHDVGLFAQDTGTAISLVDTVVRDTQPQESDGTFGRGINLKWGPTLTATRLLVEGNHEIGVYGADDGTALSLTDARVRDTLPQMSDDTGGLGIFVELGAGLTGSRLVVEGSHEVGVFALNAGTTVSLLDTIIRDTQPQASDNASGRGLSVQDGAALTATGFLVEGSHELGVYGGGIGRSTLSLTDAVIRDTLPQASDGAFGRGINVQEGAALTATRLLVERSHELGVFLASEDGPTVSLTDALIRDTLPLASDGTSGAGIVVRSRTQLSAERLAIEDSFEFGLLAVGEAVLDLRDVSVARVARTACASTDCPEVRHHGHGVAAVNAEVRLTSFQIRDATTCGVLLDAIEGAPTPTALDLKSGVVSGSEIGVCLQVDSYDVSRLTDDVQYIDNGTSLDSTTLTVPEPGSPISP